VLIPFLYYHSKSVALVCIFNQIEHILTQEKQDFFAEHQMIWLNQIGKAKGSNEQQGSDLDFRNQTR